MTAATGLLCPHSKQARPRIRMLAQAKALQMNRYHYTNPRVGLGLGLLRRTFA